MTIREKQQAAARCCRPAMDLRVAIACLLVTAQLSLAGERHDCPASSCPQPHESLDLSPLQG